MDSMFDHNHDGKLSDIERMERDYVLTEMMNGADNTPQVRRTSGSGNSGSKLLGALFLIIALNALVYFPIFAIIMGALALYYLKN